MSFQQEIEDIYRLKVPFEDIYTSVFLIKAEQGYVLVDCATYTSDVDEHILPTLCEFGLELKNIKCLILTHKHSDHAGGLSRLLEHNPMLQIVDKPTAIDIKGLTVYALKGHTMDSIGVLDTRSGTLISGDGLQGHGVGKYPCFLESKDEYIKTIDKIQKDKRIKNILFSHAYEPWNQDYALGRKEVEKCLQDCVEYITRRDKNESNRNQ